MIHGKRLLEGCLPIEAISAEASREKSVRKGHFSTLPLWWTGFAGSGPNGGS